MWKANEGIIFFEKALQETNSAGGGLSTSSTKCSENFFHKHFISLDQNLKWYLLSFFLIALEFRSWYPVFPENETWPISFINIHTQSVETLELGLQVKTVKLSLSSRDFQVEPFKLRQTSWDFQVETVKLRLSSWDFQAECVKLKLESRDFQVEAFKLRLSSWDCQAKTFKQGTSNWNFQDEAVELRLWSWNFQAEQFTYYVPEALACRIQSFSIDDAPERSHEIILTFKLFRKTSSNLPR